MQQFPNRIRELRLSRNTSGTELANILEITPQFFYNIEKGSRTLSADMALRIAGYFQVSVDYILGRTDDPNLHLGSSEMGGEGGMTTIASVDLGNSNLLSQKEEKDIAKKLQNMMDELESDSSLAFMGEPMDDEDRELLRISLENTLRMSRQMAKMKFTPKKYRK